MIVLVVALSAAVGIVVSAFGVRWQFCVGIGVLTIPALIVLGWVLVNVLDSLDRQLKIRGYYRWRNRRKVAQARRRREQSRNRRGF